METYTNKIDLVINLEILATTKNSYYQKIVVNNVTLKPYKQIYN